MFLNLVPVSCSEEFLPKRKVSVSRSIINCSSENKMVVFVFFIVRSYSKVIELCTTHEIQLV